MTDSKALGMDNETHSCVECDRLGCPTEGMTTLCPECAAVVCAGHVPLHQQRLAHATHRIAVENLSDYPWPFVAALQRNDDGEWVEVEAEGGDTPEEAVANLREQNRRAREVAWSATTSTEQENDNA